MGNIVKLASMSEREALDLVCTRNGAIAPVDRTDKRLAHFPDAFRANVTRGLQIDRDTWIVRDKGYIGLRSRPVDLSDWPECSDFDARFELAREVWCDSVRVANGGAL